MVVMSSDLGGQGILLQYFFVVMDVTHTTYLQRNSIVPLIIEFVMGNAVRIKIILKMVSSKRNTSSHVSLQY